MFYKKSSFFLSFAKFAGKHCWSLSCNEFAGLRPATLLKRRLQHRCFAVNIAKLLRTPILKNICERLFLYFRIVKKKKFILKNEKMANRKLGKVGNLGEIILSIQFFPTVKIENSDSKILEKNFRNFQGF